MNEENEQFIKEHSNALLLDALAVEIFIGQVEDDGIDTEEIEGLSPIYKTLFEQRKNIAYRAALHLHALALHINYYHTMLSGATNLKKFTTKKYKMPLYIPKEIEEYLKNSIPHFSIYATAEEEEVIRESITALFELNTIYNNSLFERLKAYIAAEGVMDRSGFSPKSSFQKIAMNKGELEGAVRNFGSELKEHEELLEKAFGDHKLFDISPLLNHYRTRYMHNVVFNVDADTKNAAELLLNSTSYDTVMRFGTKERSIVFSPRQKEKPLYDFDVIANKMFTKLSTLLIYTDAMRDKEAFAHDAEQTKKIEDAMRILDVYARLEEKSTIDNIVSNIIETGDHYLEAKEILGRHAVDTDNTLKTAYHIEAYRALLADFMTALKEKANELFELNIEKEYKKGASSALLKEEYHAFGFVSFIFHAALEKTAYKMPYVPADNTSYYTIYQSRLKEIIIEFFKAKISEYMNKRSLFIEQYKGEGGQQGEQNEDTAQVQTQTPESGSGEETADKATAEEEADTQTAPEEKKENTEKKEDADSTLAPATDPKNGTISIKEEDGTVFFDDDEDKEEEEIGEECVLEFIDEQK